MSVLFGRKTAGTTIRTLNYARWLVVGLFITSWLFSLMAAMLVQTNNNTIVSCEILVFSCIILYALSKIFIYLFLAERVHIVTSIGLMRGNSKLYKFNLGLISPYLCILNLAIIYRVAIVQDNGHCNIGLKQEAAIPLIGYDVFISSWLTFQFVRALMSSNSMLQGLSKSKLREVARSTMIGSAIALFLSSANIATIVYYEGHQRGLLCLGLCTMDVTLNAITVHWVTSRGTKSGRGGSVDGADGGDKGGGGGGGAVGPVDPRYMPFGGQGTYHGHGFPGLEKYHNPLESHISVTVELYVEEYHQMRHGERSTELPDYQHRKLKNLDAPIS
ncbi:hypothetical protein BG006_004694 [Podila minutissima]|uniref:Transmembrane protein n=1 Tax=Podila minutissima TaxID=64525 RepID=A0A9P5VQV5_9FUNG|nr:hypothetical protein BG006_004694 [Podila minutissima]